MLKDIPYQASELILNADGSVYHLKLHPEDVGDTVFLVGDPDRVDVVSGYFDTIEVRKEKREFRTHSGTLHGKRITVLSTGIGTDNIDIALQELDALVRLDLRTGQRLQRPRMLDLVRLGTSGALQEDISIGQLVISEFALGIDGLGNYYGFRHYQNEKEILKALEAQGVTQVLAPLPYLIQADQSLLNRFPDDVTRGITTTCTGFYGPQGREILQPSKFRPALRQLRHFKHNGTRVINFEMESSAIYLLARVLGHRALSCNIILANRVTGAFSEEPRQHIDRMIQNVLNHLIGK